MKGYYEELVKVLRDYGYRRVPGRGKGSHEVWTNGKRNQILPVNCPSRHTANEVLKQMGVSERFR
jgi:predicted RNA binding protein YcfA (HicA-like mRNA interferase family)